MNEAFTDSGVFTEAMGTRHAKEKVVGRGKGKKR